jgi:hypothetical protein
MQEVDFEKVGRIIYGHGRMTAALQALLHRLTGEPPELGTLPKGYLRDVGQKIAEQLSAKSIDVTTINYFSEIVQTMDSIQGCIEKLSSMTEVELDNTFNNLASAKDSLLKVFASLGYEKFPISL